MRDRIMAFQGEDESGPTEFAGQDPSFEMGTRMQTDRGRIVTILRYDKANGLYEVQDATGDVALFRISPDKLRPAPASEKK